MLFQMGEKMVEVDEIRTASCGARVGIIYPKDRSPETKAKYIANIQKICAEIAKDYARREGML